MDNEQKLQLMKDAIKSYPDFPKPGVVFRDIFGIFQDIEAMKAMKDLVLEHVSKLEVDVIVGIDSRGFLFGPTIALELEKPFLPIRKKGKLPGKVIQKSYDLEYGKNTCEIQTDYIKKGMRIILVDDLLATGGSMSAAVDLLKSVGAEIVECLVIIELPPLNGRSKLHVPVHSFLQYN